MQTKKELRKSAKILRSNLDMVAISEKFLQVLQSLDFYKKAEHIALYYPLGTEPNLLALLQDKSKKFYLPKIQQDNNLTFHPFFEGDILVENKYSILEPQTEQINSAILDVIILPALMADFNRHRLGYGKGYYDRFLAKKDISAIKIICVPDELMVEKLPVEDFDVQADGVITPARLIFGDLI